MRPAVDKALWAIGLTAAFFGIGVFQSYTSRSTQEVFITNNFGFVIAEHPIWSGLLMVATVGVAFFAFVLAWVLIWFLLRTGTLFTVVGGGMLAAGLGAALLAVEGGDLIGMRPDQRVNMVMVTALIGGMGGLMLGADLRNRWRARKSAKR